MTFSAKPHSEPTKTSLTIPDHPGLAEALGRLAIAHTHLELVLRYTVKILSGVTVQEALDATKSQGTAEVRKRVRRLFIQKKPTEDETVKLDALLGEASRLSKTRNDFLHSAWSVSEAGRPIIKLENHSWGPAPTNQEVDRAACEIQNLGEKINDERLHGFINKVAKQNSTMEGD
jgi:hypothetical protein